MRKAADFIVPVLLFLLLPLFGFPAGVSVASEITLLYINDTHGHIRPYIQKSVSKEVPVGGSDCLARMILDERSRNPEGTLLLSAGDMFQGTPISNIFRGKPVIEVMNHLQFDAMTIGNHEFDWGLDKLKDLSAAAKFPFLSANMQDPNGHSPPWVRPYVILTRKGIKVAVIGVTTTETYVTTKPGQTGSYRFVEPASILTDLIEKVRGEGARLVILLSHQGLDEDCDLAEAVSGIDVIVGGHSHTAVKTPVTVGGTVIVQAGCCGHYLGVLKLEVDEKSGKVLQHSKNRVLKKVLSGPENPRDDQTQQIVQKYHERIKDEFGRVIGETSVDLNRRPYAESNVGNLVCDVMRTAAGADIAFQNSGGMRTNIPKGKITLEMAYTLLPFDNVLITMDLTGRQIIRILEKSATLDHGLLQLSGLKVTVDLTKPAGSRILDVFVGTRPLVPGKTYRVTTNDFLAAGGDSFSAFKEGKNIVYGEPLRDLFVSHVLKHSPLNPRTEGRIVIRQ